MLMRYLLAGIAACCLSYQGGLFGSVGVLAAHAAQCNDGVDNDADGKIDALVTTGSTATQAFDNGDGIPNELFNAVIAAGGNVIFGPGDHVDQTFRNDATTRAGLCSTLGYSQVINWTAKGFSSCGDNSIADYIGGKSFDYRPACNNNSFIIYLVCGSPFAQCANGKDDDGDGLVDLNDPGCVNASDQDERTNDPGCTDPNDNTENSDQTQCQDGLDNDADGAIDLNDFSCANATDNDETNPKSQCQDLIDNDGDQAIDLADPGCGSAQDSTEGDNQCQSISYSAALGTYPENQGWDYTGINATGITRSAIQTQNGIAFFNITDGSLDRGIGFSYNGLSDATLADNNWTFEMVTRIHSSANPTHLVGMPHLIASPGGKYASIYIDTNRYGPLSEDLNPLTYARTVGFDTTQGFSRYTINYKRNGVGINDDTFDILRNGVLTVSNVTRSEIWDQEAVVPGDPRDLLFGLMSSGGTGSMDISEVNFRNTAPCGAPQCQDGVDNDGDGATDLADFSCSGALDNDEANPKSQCQDGLDNDADGLTDLNDPGCLSAQDNNESDGTSQCQDGADNDGDGATDTADFSCSSPQDNDEINPKSKCQNGIDDDADGLTDLADPGCSSTQDNNEADGTSQCQDGVDNDADGSVDLTDFSCSSATDNDEANPKAQCQNNVDDDADGLIDLADPGCSSKQDNTEGSATSQCQDGVDNDGDGATDLADYSCSNPQDNDESNPKSQCQDGIDNDGDGAVDLSDFSCSGRQDNDEANPKAQCQDGIDNDSDSLIDLADPGCASRQDNNESDGTAQCQDGVDNDADGAIDLADFSCASTQDNDETNPKAQCQDGLDNDNDGLVDLNDPGCASRQDNTENDGTSQCQDGIDNDGDGAVDSADFSCSNPQDTDETNPKSQCQDGLDNDGDGATDLNDFSCSNRQDNDEANPKSQCQDGLDNDSDGLIDLADPGCSNRQDNNEGDNTTQCQDGIDNDGDGAIDAADFSCSNPQDTDETNPKSACQDGLDNDSDGLVDLADPGCSSRQDNNEGDGTSQCQDGIDNDGDGATDSADFSCTNPQDNDETNPKSQCQDGVDNDSDGAIDSADFSCSNPQDSDETNPKSACQDGIDNDSDGLIDLADPGCSSRQDNNEGDGTSQCQDGIDNDGDGATDAADFSCSNPQDPDENNPKSQCQDGIDNDGDGLVDSADPGCSNNQDNKEADDLSPIAPIAECVFDNKDGTYTGYFGYQNLNASTVVINVQSTGTGPLNYFSGVENRGQVTTFQPGRVKGVVRVVFDGNTLTWNIRATGTQISAASLSRFSTPCNPVVPLIECIDFSQGGGYEASFSYRNENDFAVTIPVGLLNAFSPLPIDRGQSSSFQAGNVLSAFKVRFPAGSSLLWALAGRNALATENSPLCPTSQGCTLTPTVETREELDATALSLAETTKRIANMLVDLSNNQPRVIIDATRSKTKADKFVKEANELTYKFPDVIRSCPTTPEFCAQVDNKPTIDALASLYRRQFNQAKRSAARGDFRGQGKTRGNKLVKSARKTYENGLKALETIPRFATECE